MILEVKDLHVCFRTLRGPLKAVEGVSLSLGEAEILGIVGESGCGKTVTALSILRLLPERAGVEVKGEIWFEGRDLLKLEEAEMLQVRGKKISMIFQEPVSSLNPVLTVGRQVSEVLWVHYGLPLREAHSRAREVLKKVRLPDVERVMGEYPHRLSGGMCQRVMIAMALACNPRILIADEPTTALDVTIQAQILDLLEGLKDEFKMAVILITHDLGIVARIAQRVIVLYAGRIVEEAPVEGLFEMPLHPYTQGLLRSVPPLRRAMDDPVPLQAIPGMVPSPISLPEGCKFHPRCERAQPVCRESEPALSRVDSFRFVRCFFPG